MNYDKLLEIYRSGKGDINIPDVNGWTLLIWASSQGNLEVVKGLLKRGVDIEKAGNIPEAYGGLNALEVACVYGYIEIVRLLIQHGANLSRINPVSCNSLLITVLIYSNTKIEIIKELLEHMSLSQINYKRPSRFDKLARTALDISSKHPQIHELIKNKVEKAHLNTLRSIKSVVFKAFDAMDTHKVIEPALSPAQLIAEFCGVPKGLCNTKEICVDNCKHFAECKICAFTTKYKSTMEDHEMIHV